MALLHLSSPNFKRQRFEIQNPRSYYTSKIANAFRLIQDSDEKVISSIFDHARKERTICNRCRPARHADTVCISYMHTHVYMYM